MPERNLSGQTQVTLKFAAGDDKSRVQLSSTWYVRMTRGLEVYILNRDAGGERAHVSLHQDGRVHYKVADPTAKGGEKKLAVWDLPELEDRQKFFRLATVVIPHRGLVLPPSFSGTDPETVLIDPPAVDEQLEVDILIELGPVPKDAWPGKTAGQGTSYVGRISIYDEADEGNPFVHCTVVTTLCEEAAFVKGMSRSRVQDQDGNLLTGFRGVHFTMGEVDGRKLPILTEMPVGHWPIDG